MASAFYNEKPLNEKEDGEELAGQTSFVAREDEPRPAVADAFALREGDEDQEDFKTLGWFKAGLVLTCEVSRLATVVVWSDNQELTLPPFRLSRSELSRSLRTFTASAWPAASSPTARSL